MPLLELKSVSVGYGHNCVLQNVDLTLEHGEIVTLLGANGAGKSTLAKSISGLLRIQAGRILMEGEPIDAMLPAERLRRGIAHVPEGRQIFAGMSVAENLELGAYASAKADYAARLESVWKLFPLLRDRMKDIAGNFSGGQQQMLAIARALMSKPRILLLDEPSLGVAPLLVAEIFRLIVALRAQGIAILLAEQNARQALSIADRGYVFENGKIALSGSSKALLNSADIAERYLGMGGAAEISETASEVLASRLRNVLFPAPSNVIPGDELNERTRNLQSKSVSMDSGEPRAAASGMTKAMTRATTDKAKGAGHGADPYRAEKGFFKRSLLCRDLLPRRRRAAVRDDRAALQDGGGGRERRHRHHREPCQQSAVGMMQPVSSLPGARARKQSGVVPAKRAERARAGTHNHHCLRCANPSQDCVCDGNSVVMGPRFRGDDERGGRSLRLQHCSQ